jgi:hypothetical protein
MEKHDDQLIDFLQKHPEYFSGDAGAQSIRSDLKSAVETYAKAIDPIAYEELSQRLLDFQAHSRAQLQERMAKLIKEKEEHSRHLKSIEIEFSAYQSKIAKLRNEMSRYQADQRESNRSGSKRARGDYLFVILDIAGIIFLYAGFILSEQIDYSIVLMGCMFFIAGFWMHRGGRSKAVIPTDFSGELKAKIQSRYDYVQEIWAVKKLTLQQTKKESLDRIELIDREIRKSLQGIGANSDQH